LLGHKVEFEKCNRLKASEIVYKIAALSIVLGVLRDKTVPS